MRSLCRYERQELKLTTEGDTYFSVCAVYEHIVFSGHSHLSIRSLPGMAGRTLRIGSAGKTFSLTDWKVLEGYMSGILNVCVDRWESGGDRVLWSMGYHCSQMNYHPSPLLPAYAKPSNERTMLYFKNYIFLYFNQECQRS